MLVAPELSVAGKKAAILSTSFELGCMRYCNGRRPLNIFIFIGHGELERWLYYKKSPPLVNFFFVKYQTSSKRGYDLCKNCLPDQKCPLIMLTT